MELLLLFDPLCDIYVSSLGEFYSNACIALLGIYINHMTIPVPRSNDSVGDETYCIIAIYYSKVALALISKFHSHRIFRILTWSLSLRGPESLVGV